MHGNLQDVEEMKQILEEEKLEEREGAIGEIALSEGEYIYRTQLLKDDFDSDSDRGIWPARGAVAAVSRPGEVHKSVVSIPAAGNPSIAVVTRTGKTVSPEEEEQQRIPSPPS